MPRGRPRKKRFNLKIKSEALRSVVVVALLVFWLISFISFFLPDYPLNQSISGMWYTLFGGVALVAPILLVVIAIMLVERIKTRLKEPRVVFGLFMLYFTLVALAHVFVPAGEAYDTARAGNGGGMVGYHITKFLISTMSKAGTVILLVGSLIISLLVLFNLSIDQIMEKSEPLLAKLGALKNIRLSKKEATEDDSAEDEIEINSGVSLEDGDTEPVEEAAHVKVTAQQESNAGEDFSVEIVPSLSEPQMEILVEKDPSTVNTLINDAKAPSLPYVDSIWRLPPLELLEDYSNTKSDAGDVEGRSKTIKDTLASFDIKVEVQDIASGPSVTQYQLKAESGVKVSKIANLQNDLALALASPTGTVRVEAPIPGKSLIGIEVPNNTRAIVGFKSMINSEPMKELKSKLGIVLGKDVAGKVYTYDIGKMPHLLIAGTTGSGKSIFIHNILFSILFRANPNEVKFILIDPKMVELTYYQGIPHLYTPVVKDMATAPSVFSWAVSEMGRRYELFERARVRNIEGYNKESGFQALPYIVIVVEELGEIMQVDPNGVEKSIIRLAQLARATGIHLILTVQRPDTKIITGLIKANITTRVAFNVMSQIDSRVIIDQPGAEKLLGRGDMLFIPPDMSRPIRLQGAMISEKEIADLVNFLKSQNVDPDYREEIVSPPQKVQSTNTSMGTNVDPLFNDAVEIVSVAGKASASLLQRKLSIGYARAARIIDELEEAGIIGPADGQKPRDVIKMPDTQNKPGNLGNNDKHDKDKHEMFDNDDNGETGII